MSEILRAAIIGTGRPWNAQGRTGSGMAHLHMQGYNRAKDCQVVALADINPESATAFSEQYNLNAALYTDFKKLLKKEQPDLVSICLWPHLHTPAVIACALAGVKAIHCEKPMAPNWGDALKMVAACERSKTQLTFNHQRRFLPAFQKAKQLLNEGVIGDLVRIEGSCDNMIDWGTHWLDMFFFYNAQSPAIWVLGQIDARQWHEVFGLPYEHQAICEVKFQNGVRGVLYTGEDREIGCAIRLMGTDGIIELREGEIPLWVRGKGAGSWKNPKVKGHLHDSDAVGDAIVNMVDSLRNGTEPELSARRALQVTEVIFATYESARRRGRVDLPLRPRDSAYLSMVEDGTLKPKNTPKK